MNLIDQIRAAEDLPIDNDLFTNWRNPANNDKPLVDWHNKQIHTELSYQDAILQATRLVAYWKSHNDVPDFIEEYLQLKDTHFQRDAIIRCIAVILQGKDGIQLLAGTGTGKTYMAFAVFDILVYYDYIKQLESLEGRNYPFPIVVFTPCNVVEQSNTVKKLYPNIKDKCFVLNYETLRTKLGFGNIFIEWTTTSKNGEIEEIPVWRIETSPCLVQWDENQKLQNDKTLQTKFARALRNLKLVRKIVELHTSASPFINPIGSKTVVLSIAPITMLTDEYVTKIRKYWRQNNKILSQTNKREEHLITRELVSERLEHVPRVTANNFHQWLKDEICFKTRPEEYSPAAMERITDFLSVDHQLVTVSDVKFKHKTINKHVLINFTSPQEKQVYDAAYEDYIDTLLKTNRNAPGGMAAIFVAMLKFRMAAELLRASHLAKLAITRIHTGRNVILATAFRETQDAIIRHLKDDYGYTSYSIIKGGQSKKVRWQNVNDFQDEKTNLILVMIQAGGVGLSLHHHKPRNKRPRHVIMPPVWSIIEMLQMLGRAHRINSESTTHQEIIWYTGTMEQSVCKKLQEKALSMRELMRRRENWSDLFVNESLRERMDIRSIYKENEEQAISKDNAEDDDDSADFFNQDAEMMADNVETSEETTVTVG